MGTVACYAYETLATVQGSRCEFAGQLGNVGRMIGGTVLLRPSCPALDGGPSWLRARYPRFDFLPLQPAPFSAERQLASKLSAGTTRFSNQKGIQ